MTRPRLLMVPGLGDSGPAHWQSLWQAADPGIGRVVQRDWDNPDRAEWIAALDRQVAAIDGPVLLVAHSLGCALIAHWAAKATGAAVAGAFLVSASDVDSPAHTPTEVRGFAPMPQDKLPFPSVVVASSDDPFCTLARARHFAGCWGAQFVDIGPAGHINAASGLGDWATGLQILERTFFGNQP